MRRRSSRCACGQSSTGSGDLAEPAVEHGAEAAHVVELGGRDRGRPGDSCGVDPIGVEPDPGDDPAGAGHLELAGRVLLQ